MKSVQTFLVACALACAVTPLALASSPAVVAYPSHYDIEPTDDLVPFLREVYGGGQIIDISQWYHPDMPSWESSDGVGQFLWLSKSMENGSLANNSEMKLPVYTGTHLDAPGNVFDHYFDAGFDVDTLDLDVLNGIDDV